MPAEHNPDPDPLPAHTRRYIAATWAVAIITIIVLIVVGTVLGLATIPFILLGALCTHLYMTAPYR